MSANLLCISTSVGRQCEVTKGHCNQKLKFGGHILHVLWPILSTKYDCALFIQRLKPWARS